MMRHGLLFLGETSRIGLKSEQTSKGENAANDDVLGNHKR